MVIDEEIADLWRQGIVEPRLIKGELHWRLTKAGVALGDEMKRLESVRQGNKERNKDVNWNKESLA